jgi:uncharacterized protein YbjT (DUF2867 family)
VFGQQRFAGNPAFSTMVGVDAAKPSTLTQAFEGADYAVIVTPHDAAGGMEVSFFRLLLFCLLTKNTRRQNDALFTCNMIAAAEQTGVKHVVFVGSWTVGAVEAIPEIAKRFVQPEGFLFWFFLCLLPQTFHVFFSQRR